MSSTLPPLQLQPQVASGHAGSSSPSPNGGPASMEQQSSTPNSRFRSLPLFVSSTAKQGRGATPQAGSRPGTSPQPLRPTTPAAASTAALAASLQSLRPDTAPSPPNPATTAAHAGANAAFAAASAMTRAQAWASSAGGASASPTASAGGGGGFVGAGGQGVGASTAAAFAKELPPASQHHQSAMRSSAMTPSTPPLFVSSGVRPVTSGSANFKDLLTATRKTLASGMGEWDLQPPQWNHPDFQSQLLQGPLGPELLHNKHGMSEREIVQLYRTLYTYSTGFCAAVFEPVRGARQREQLLESVFAAYAGLWDEAVGVCFRSEVINTIRDKSGAVISAEDLASQLGQSRAEAAELNARLNQFVRNSIDSMLAQRLLHDQARAAEAEALMLNKSSDVMGVRLAGAEVKVQALTSQLEACMARTTAAEAALTEREAQIGKLRAAMSEQQAQLAKQSFQIMELDRARAVASAAVETEKAARVEAEREAAKSPFQEEEWERRVADKALAYNLLHADFIVKMHDLDAIREANARLQEKVDAMHDTYNTAARQIQEAEAKADKYRVKWEQGRMLSADMESAAKRQGERNRDLVTSYWPLMKRLKDVEGANAAALERAERAERECERVLAETAELRGQLDERVALRREIERLKHDLDMEVPPPSDVTLSALYPDKASARAYVRTTQRRIKDLSQQLVRLVDVHAGCAKRIQHHEVVDGALRSKIQALEVQLKAAREAGFGAVATARRISHGGNALVSPSGLGSPMGMANTATSGGGGGGVGGVGGVPDAVVAELQACLAQASQKLQQETVERMEAERRAAKAEAALGVSERRLAAWLCAVAQQAGALTQACEATLVRDPQRPEGIAMEAARQLEAAVAAEAAAAAAAAAAAEAEGTAAAAAPASAEGRGGGGGGSSGGGAAAASAAGAAPAPSEGATASPAVAATKAEAAPLPGVASGRLAQSAGALAETDATAIAADWRWEQLCECLERMQDWGSCLLDQRLQVQHLHDLHSQLADALQSLSRERWQAEELRTQLAAATDRADRLQASCSADATDVERLRSALSEAEQTRSALETALKAAQDEASSASQRLANIDQEYWEAKSKLLEAELSRGELLAARDRALATAERAEARMKQVEKGVDEHRFMRQKLELDLIACKAWLRSAEEKEKEYKGAAAEAAEAKEQLRVQANLVEELQAQVAKLHAQSPTAKAPPSSSDYSESGTGRSAAAAAAAPSARELAAAWECEARAREAAAAARAKASAADARVRAAEQRLSELRGTLAGMQRSVEDWEARLRHAQADKQTLEATVADLRQALGEEEARTKALQQEVWDLGVAVRAMEADRKVALQRLVDRRFERGASERPGDDT